jgi:aryl-alcohol dehydrogenase-like predicted oxidoreductase
MYEYHYFMQTRRLGNSDLEITRIGFGAWAIGGGDWMFGWGPQDDADSIAAITRAVDLGINWIDTAAAYGLGHSEDVVRRALNGLPASRRPYVFTKCSLVWNETRELSHSLAPDSIRREVEGSLTRLGVDTIDLYQIHWPRWGSSPPGYDPGSIADAWQALTDLKRDGKVRYIGVSNFTVADLEAAERVAPITSLQPPYSALRRDIEADVLPWCLAHNVGVIVYSPMQSGLLSGAMTRDRVAALPQNDWRRRAKYFQEPYLSQGLALAERLREVGARYGRTPGEAAIAWTLRHPAVTAAIVGARRADQLDGIVGAADIQLSESDFKEIG